MPAAFARPELLASPDWLAEHLSRPGIRVVGCRYRVGGAGRPGPAAGHLAGPDGVAAAMSRGGVGDGATAILYDDTASLYASRVWWSLRCYGFEGVRVLDGGRAAWGASGGPAFGLVAARGPAEYRGREGNAKRLGHIPGAVNVPAALLTGPGSQVFETPERLSRLYVEAGVQRGRRGGLYDGAG